MPDSGAPESKARSAGRSRVFAPGLLAGRAALVTGGGTGLGRATALELARCGAAVTIVGRREDTLAQAVEEIHAALGCATGPIGWVAGDVREPEPARRMVRAAMERHGRLDFLINNAGGQYFTPAEGIVEKGWRAVWRLNVEGILNMSQAAVELGLGEEGSGGGGGGGGAGASGEVGEMGGAGVAAGNAAGGAAGAGGVAEGGAGGAAGAEGRIVNVTLSPHHGMPGMAHSGAARASAEALTRELAGHWARRGIAVVAVAAGHFDTEVMVKYPESVRAGMARSVPLQRLGRPEEHAWLVALLCSPVGRALSGSTVTLDGARDNWFGPWPPPGLTGATGEVPTEARRSRGDAG